MSQFDDLFKSVINESYTFCHAGLYSEAGKNACLYNTIKAFFNDILPHSKNPDVDAERILKNLKDVKHPVVNEILQLYPTNKPLHILNFIKKRLFPNPQAVKNF